MPKLITSVCSDCGETFTRLYQDYALKKNGDLCRTPRCNSCVAIRKKKYYRGRTTKDILKMDARRELGCHTLSEEEIAAIADTLTPPSLA